MTDSLCPKVLTFLLYAPVHFVQLATLTGTDEETLPLVMTSSSFYTFFINNVFLLLLFLYRSCRYYTNTHTRVLSFNTIPTQFSLLPSGISTVVRHVAVNMEDWFIFGCLPLSTTATWWLVIFFSPSCDLNYLSNGCVILCFCM